MLQRFQLDRRKTSGKRYLSPCWRSQLRTRQKGPREFRNRCSSAASGSPHRPVNPAGIERRNSRAEPSLPALIEEQEFYRHNAPTRYARLRCQPPGSVEFTTVTGGRSSKLVIWAKLQGERWCKPERERHAAACVTAPLRKL